MPPRKKFNFHQKAREVNSKLCASRCVKPEVKKKMIQRTEAVIQYLIEEKMDNMLIQRKDGVLQHIVEENKENMMLQTKDGARTPVVQHIVTEKEKNTRPAACSVDEILCKVCREDKRSVVLNPCLHFAVCVTCSNNIKSCPVCTGKVTHKLIVYWD